MSTKTTDNMLQTISDMRSARSVGGMKTIAIIASLLIYVAIVGYTEYHFYNLVSRYVTAGFEIVAYLAVGASFLTALALPVALHVWLRSGVQQVTGFLFYGAHWLIVMFNLVLDSNLTAGGEVPAWVAGVYGVWILPMYLSFYGIGWAILWFLDPTAQEIDDVREVEAVERENEVQRRLGLARAVGNAVEQAYNSYQAKQVINTYAARKAPQLLASELGTTLQELGLGDNAIFSFWEEGQQRPQGQGQGDGAKPYYFLMSDGGREYEGHDLDDLKDYARYRAFPTWITDTSGHVVWRYGGNERIAAEQGERPEPAHVSYNGREDAPGRPTHGR